MEPTFRVVKFEVNQLDFFHCVCLILDLNENVLRGNARVIRIIAKSDLRKTHSFYLRINSYKVVVVVSVLFDCCTRRTAFFK